MRQRFVQSLPTVTFFFVYVFADSFVHSINNSIEHFRVEHSDLRYLQNPGISVSGSWILVLTFRAQGSVQYKTRVLALVVLLTASWPGLEASVFHVGSHSGCLLVLTRRVLRL